MIDKLINDFIDQIEEVINEKKYERDIVIDHSNLAEEIVKQPSIFSYYSTLYAIAEYLASRLKIDLEKTWAELYKKYCASFEKKPTEKQIEALILTDKQYIDANNDYILWQTYARILKGVVDSLHQKSKMLIARLALDKAELQQLLIKDKI